MKKFSAEWWGNLWFDIRWLFFTKKQKRAWRIKPWSWTQKAEPLVCHGIDGLWTEHEQAMFIALMRDRMEHPRKED